MSYLEKFVYAVAENHYKDLQRACIRPRCMFDLIHEEVERGLIQATLEYTGFNLTSCADVLGMSITTLRSKLKKYNIFVLKV